MKVYLKELALHLQFESVFSTAKVHYVMWKKDEPKEWTWWLSVQKEKHKREK